MQDAIYRKWWFWVVLVALLAGAWWGGDYYEWWRDTARYRELNRDAASYWQELEEQSAELEDAYRNDTYGGETPEETLELFVGALEAKDFELAAKYFVVEEQEEMIAVLTDLGGGEAFSTYLNILHGRSDGVMYDSGEKYEIRFVDSSGEQVHIEFFFLNPFTQKWKILEL